MKFGKNKNWKKTMDVFLSWSGPQSSALASVFNNWLPMCINALNPYYTPDDISKGARWLQEINGRLEGCNAGIIFITKENFERPWILFEAGALSKSMGDSAVFPLLFNMTSSQLSGPLTQFQSTEFSKTEVIKMMNGLNELLVESAISKSHLEKTVDALWGKLEKDVELALMDNPIKQSVPNRSKEEISSEILKLSRENSKIIQDISARLYKVEEIAFSALNNQSLSRNRLDKKFTTTRNLQMREALARETHSFDEHIRLLENEKASLARFISESSNPREHRQLVNRIDEIDTEIGKIINSQ